jgi:hypothetical protein
MTNDHQRPLGPAIIRLDWYPINVMQADIVNLRPKKSKADVDQGATIERQPGRLFDHEKSRRNPAIERSAVWPLILFRKIGFVLQQQRLIWMHFGLVRLLVNP